MKIIKSITAVFLLSIVCALSGVKANDGFASFANVKIPAFGGTYTSPAYNKTHSGPQQTVDSTDMTTPMKARTRAFFAPTGTTSYIKLVIDKHIGWGNQNTGINQYKLEVKCINTNLLNEAYWGLWRYNWPV